MNRRLTVLARMIYCLMIAYIALLITTNMAMNQWSGWTLLKICCMEGICTSVRGVRTVILITQLDNLLSKTSN